MPIKMRSTANKSTTQRMNPSWQSRNFAWNGYWNSSRMDTATIMCRMALNEIMNKDMITKYPFLMPMLMSMIRTSFIMWTVP